MSKKKAKKYIKKKSDPNQPGPGYNTSSNFRKNVFSKGSNFGKAPKKPQGNFNPATFKTQHKG